MPRGRVPSLISFNNGGINFATAKRACQCSRCKVPIANGSKCGELKTIRAGFSTTKRHCLQCTSNIIEKTQEDLNQIKINAGI